jgi:hypothetical protein
MVLVSRAIDISRWTRPADCGLAGRPNKAGRADALTKAHCSAVFRSSKMSVSRSAAVLLDGEAGAGNEASSRVDVLCNVPNHLIAASVERSCGDFRFQPLWPFLAAGVGAP